MYITLKHDSSCADCGAVLPAGTRARWFRNGDVYGNDCHRWRVRGLTERQEKALASAAAGVVQACRGRVVPDGAAARLAALKATFAQEITKQNYARLLAELRAVRKELGVAQTAP